MASITFAVSKVDVCTKQHTETQDLSESDLARWAAKDQKLSLENFQTNYPLVDELKGTPPLFLEDFQNSKTVSPIKSKFLPQIDHLE